MSVDGVAPVPARSLTWVHLSDLHFGHGQIANHRFDQKLVTQAIVRDLNLVVEQLGAPDYVFLTGDIAFSADAKEQYPSAQSWLASVTKALGIEADRLLIVPGNHDVDRRAAAEHGRLAQLALRASPRMVDELFAKSAEMAAIWPKLNAYQEFTRAYGAPVIRPDNPFWEMPLNCTLGPVVALGLNTTLLSFDDKDSNENLALGLGQIQRALDGQSRDTLLVVLQHHPPDWLVDGDKERQHLQQWPHLLLYGHVHTAEAFLRLPVTSEGMLELVAGAGHQDAREEGSHEYAWGRLSSDGFDYYRRVWSKSHAQFVPPSIPLSGDFARQHRKLGSYISVPRERLPKNLRQWLAARQPDAASDPDLSRVEAPGPAPEASPSGNSFDPRAAYFFVLHRPKSEGATGRKEVLVRLREQLLNGPTTTLGHTASLVGIGGLGKTQTAVNYAYEYQASYPGGVYWFNAQEDLDSQLTHLAREARWVNPESEPRLILDMAIRQIRTRSDCLVVFDDVDDWRTIEFLLPEPGATPHLLLTSRYPQPGFDGVPITLLDEAQSLDMLAFESRRKIEDPADRAAAQRIVKQLGGLPLALELVGAYLRRYSDARWLDQADRLDEEGIRALDGDLAREGFTKHQAGLRATLLLGNRAFNEAPLVREVINLLAWSGSASMGRSLMVAALDSGKPTSLTVALDAAESLRIIVREQERAGASEPRFMMHGLVRQVRRLDAPLENEREWWQQVVKRLGDWFHVRSRHGDHLCEIEAELDHLEAWQRNADDLGIAHETVRLEWLRAYPASHRGRYRQGRDLILNALRRYEVSRCDDRELLAAIYNDAGEVFAKLGDREAFKFVEQGLAIRREILGERHVDTARSLHAFGSVYDAFGDYRTALRYCEQALEIRRTELGLRHRDTASSLNNVGAEYIELGEYQAGLSYVQQASEVEREILGPQHFSAAANLSNAGAAYYKLGKHQAALDCYQRALQIHQDIFGTQHPDTATSLNNLGSFYCEVGQPQVGLPYVQQALEITRDVLGIRHPVTAKALSNLGGAYRRLGDRRVALQHCREAFEILREVVGLQHPSTATTLNNLGTLYAELGSHRKGIECLAPALEILGEVLGETHSDTIACRLSLASCLATLKKKGPALQVLKLGLKYAPSDVRLRALLNTLRGKPASAGTAQKSRVAAKARAKKR